MKIASTQAALRLALHCLLQLLQAPARIVFYIRVRASCPWLGRLKLAQEIQRLNGDIQECMRQLTQAPAWRSSKVRRSRTLGNAFARRSSCPSPATPGLYWECLHNAFQQSPAEVVWLLNSTYCQSCPGLYRSERACFQLAFSLLQRLSLTVVVASFLKLLLTLVVFNRCFPVRGEARQGAFGVCCARPRSSQSRVALRRS